VRLTAAALLPDALWDLSEPPYPLYRRDYLGSGAARICLLAIFGEHGLTGKVLHMIHAARIAIPASYLFRTRSRFGDIRLGANATRTPR
jgi:hypothetical protein